MRSSSRIDLLLKWILLMSLFWTALKKEKKTVSTEELPVGSFVRNVVLLTENEGLGVIFPPATMLFLIVLCHLLKSNAVFHDHVLPFFKKLFLQFFFIFFSWYVNIVPVYYYCLYLPSPLMCVWLRADLLDLSEVWLYACQCVCRHAIKRKCTPHYHSVLFSVPCAVSQRLKNSKKEEKKKTCLSRCTTSRVMNYNLVRWWTSQCPSSQYRRPHRGQSINGLLSSVLLLYCVDFVIWNVSVQFLYVFFHNAEGSSNSIGY